MGTIERIVISSANRERLEELVGTRSTAPKVALRARIILLAADGLPTRAIAAATGKSEVTVRLWRRRYAAKGVDGLLKDEPRSRPPLSAQKIKQVVEMTLHEAPPNATHWTARTMAAAVGISPDSVRRIWRARGVNAPWIVPSVRMRTVVSSADRGRLEELVGARSTLPKVVRRARIVLLAGDGLTARAIAAVTGKSVLTVRRWRRRYAAKGVDGLLKDEPRGRPPLSAQKIKQVLDMTLRATPPNATHWTAHTMAAAVGISHASVRRIWRTHKLDAPWVVPSVRMTTVVSLADRGRLEELVRARDTSQKVVWRARIILLAADGLPARTIAAVVGKSKLTVRRWRRRYAAKGLEGLLDAPFGRPPLTARKQVVDMTLNETPSNATHWTASSMAAATGISEATVRRIWRAHGLKPQIKTRKASRRP